MTTYNHTFCGETMHLLTRDYRTACGQLVDIVDSDADGPDCDMCLVMNRQNICPLGGSCTCDQTSADDNEQDDDEGCKVYDCGCDSGCGCGDCWDCHYDEDCDCEDCSTRYEEAPDARFVRWSDRKVWRDVFLGRGTLTTSQREEILTTVGRNVDYDYNRVRTYDGAFGQEALGQEPHYDQIMKGFRWTYANRAERGIYT